jgi:hypothetical protein
MNWQKPRPTMIEFNLSPARPLSLAGCSGASLASDDALDKRVTALEARTNAVQIQLDQQKRELAQSKGNDHHQLQQV